MVWAYQRCYGIDSIIFRFSNVYGMYDESDRLVPLFIGRARRGDDLIVYGKDKILDFTYIDDTVDGMLSGIRNFDAAKNDTYNLAYGKGISLVDVAKEMKRLIGSKSKVDVRKSRVGEVVRYIADIKKAKRVLGYKPKIHIEEGLKKSVEWYTANKVA